MFQVNTFLSKGILNELNVIETGLKKTAKSNIYTLLHSPCSLGKYITY